MLGALDLLVARGRDDLRVVRYRYVRVWQDYQLLETPGFSCGFQSARGRHGGRPSSLSLIGYCTNTLCLCAFVRTNSVTQQMLNPLTKPTKAQSHDSHKDSNQKTLYAQPTQFNLRPNEHTSCLCERPIHTLEVNGRYLRANNMFIFD